MSKLFVKLHTIESNWDGSSYKLVNGIDTLVRLDSILQINQLTEAPVFERCDNYSTYKSKFFHKALVSTITVSAIHGHGINGIDSDIIIDEESYKKLIKLLDIEDI